MTNTNLLITAALQYFRENVDAAFYDAAQLERTLQGALETVIPENVGLTSYTTDYETILLQLVQALQTDNAWREVVTAGTGQTLLRNISSGIAALHMALIRATQENFSHTAQSDSAILANARFLGVNPRRAIPHQVAVQLTAADYSGTFVIPKLSVFVINGVAYFNRERIVFNELTLTQSVTLFEGVLYSAELIGEGKRFETVSIGSNNGRISAEDVYVFVNGVEWTRKAKPWLIGRNERAFVERTDNANVSVRFGDGAYGAVVPVNADVEIRWAETDGARAVNIPVGSPVTAPFVGAQVSLTGLVVSAPFGGDAPVPTSVYKTMAPQMRAADKTAINRAGFRAVALDYANVADAYFRGAAENAPQLRSWMNLYTATVLTRSGAPFTDTEWAAFVAYIKANSADNIQIVRQDPYPIEVDISADVYFNQEASINANVETVRSDIQAFFAPKLGSLGYSVFATDLGSKLEGTENTLDPNISRLIEYGDNVQVTYANTPPFVDAGAYPTAGLIAGNIICPNTRYWIKLRNIAIEGHYTTRGLLAGRRDQ